MFTPTTWVNGGAPGISAAELQRIETGIAELWQGLSDLNTQTADYTLVLADAGKVIEMNKATAVQVTVPPNADVAFAVGTKIAVVAVGAGQVTVVAGSGVTIRTARTLVLSTQWSVAELYKRATNEWVLYGDLVAA